MNRSILSDLQQHTSIENLIEEIRQDLHTTSGLLLPPPSIELADEGDLSGDFYSLAVRGIPLKSANRPDSDDLAGEWKLQIVSALLTLKVELVDDIMTRRMLDSIEEYAPDLGYGCCSRCYFDYTVNRDFKTATRRGYPCFTVGSDSSSCS